MTFLISAAVFPAAPGTRRRNLETQKQKNGNGS
jgi:hypothetical protein